MAEYVPELVINGKSSLCRAFVVSSLRFSIVWLFKMLVVSEEEDVSGGKIGGKQAKNRSESSAVSDSAEIVGRCDKGKKVDGEQAKNQSESSAVSDPAENEDAELM